jgi:DNA repair protein RadA/Sms
MAPTHTTASRARTEFACDACGACSPRWSGRCAGCGEWNTLAAVAARPSTVRFGEGHRPGAVALREVSTEGARPLPTGVSELDRVLGGGVVAGSVTLLFGPPGIGKSTLLFQVLSSLAATGSDVLLASAEESLTQVSGRAARLGRVPAQLLALEGPDVEAIEAATERGRPALVVVDSLQSVTDPGLAQPAGSVAQVRACVERLTRFAKTSGVPFLVVGHVTKDGDPAGPRAVEHLVDTVLSFDGDRHHALRVLTAVKHRFGPAGEVGIFEMRDDGLRAVPDPGPLMLGDRIAGVPGSVVVPVMQGRRPLLVEVQALLGPGPAGMSSRPHALGLDPSRANLLRALLACRSEVEFSASSEFFVAAVGGISVTEPAADLAVALAMASVVNGTPVPPDLVAFGELGLGGELRTVPEADRRLAEAWRGGFVRALVPASIADDAATVCPPHMAVHGVRTLAEALVAALGPAGTPTAAGTMPEWSTVPAASSR